MEVEPNLLPSPHAGPQGNTEHRIKQFCQHGLPGRVGSLEQLGRNKKDKKLADLTLSAFAPEAEVCGLLECLEEPCFALCANLLDGEGGSKLWCKGGLFWLLAVFHRPRGWGGKTDFPGRFFIWAPSLRPRKHNLRAFLEN